MDRQTTLIFTGSVAIVISTIVEGKWISIATLSIVALAILLYIIEDFRHG